MDRGVAEGIMWLMGLGLALVVLAITVPEESTKTQVLHADSVEEHIREEFKNTPILITIAKCESGFKQFNTNGDVLRGRKNPKDIGVMQINEYHHLEQSKKLGLDIHTLQGNIAYAKWLYEKEGSRPWNTSAKCWRG